MVGILQSNFLLVSTVHFFQKKILLILKSRNIFGSCVFERALLELNFISCLLLVYFLFITCF